MSELEKRMFVRLTFDKVNGLDNEIKGRVVEIDRNPEGAGVELFAEIDPGGDKKPIHYYEGEFEGEPFQDVLRHDERRKDVKIGENATWEQM